MTRILPKLIVLFGLLFYVSTAFKPYEDTFLTASQSKLLQGLKELEFTTAELHKALSEQNLKESQRLFHKSRRVFKTHEFLLEYFHHSSIKKRVNGAPLPQIEEKVADLNVMEPQGFQRIEELIYEDAVDWTETAKLAKKLNQEISAIKDYQPRIPLYDRHIIEAMRFEIIRIYTLGLTGFENPASDSTMREVLYAFQSLKEPAIHYAARAGESYKKSIEKLFNAGIKRLQNADFETFDRLAFLKEVSDPIYKQLLEIHLALGIETFEEVNTAPVTTNYSATSLFDINLLNKDYFLQLRASEITPAQVELGKLLFFDPALSYNNALSCSSCHHPDKAFTDGRAKSLSNDSEHEVDRNAPTLVNALFSGAYFHDLRAGKIEMQTEHVMANPQEFNVRPLELADKLKESSEYVALFEKAFPGIKDPIQPRTMKTSLAVYVSSLVSWNSPFDKYVRGESETLSASAQSGFNIFMGKGACGTCHFAPNFNGIVPPFYDDTESEVLGITKTNDTLNLVLDEDEGRYRNGKRAEQAEHFRFSMKTPTIRNIELTGPYFHNGAYPTLEEVMWFYNRGGGLGLGLDIPNQTLPSDQLGLNEKEISDVIAFMKSLTDIDGLQSTPDNLPDFDNDPSLQNRKPVIY